MSKIVKTLLYAFGMVLIFLLLVVVVTLCGCSLSRDAARAEVSGQDNELVDESAVTEYKQTALAVRNQTDSSRTDNSRDTEINFAVQPFPTAGLAAIACEITGNCAPAAKPIDISVPVSESVKDVIQREAALSARLVALAATVDSVNNSLAAQAAAARESIEARGKAEADLERARGEAAIAIAAESEKKWQYLVVAIGVCGILLAITTLLMHSPLEKKG